jgi:elongation factor Ts
MAISAKDVMALRQKSGLGMMECKQALTETDGDLQKAIDLLRQKGLAKMDSRTDRTSAEGRVEVAVNAGSTKAAIIEVNTETDFTATNDSFKAMAATVASEALKQNAGEVEKTDAIQAAIDAVRLTTKENAQFARGAVLGGGAGQKVGSYVHFNGKIGAILEVKLESGASADDDLLRGICQHIVANPIPPIGILESDVPAELVEKEKQIAKAQAIEQGKPEQIAEKMVSGKIRKFFEDQTLLLQLYIKDDKKRIKELLPKGVSITRFARYIVGGK